jgi:hypothetical protein
METASRIVNKLITTVNVFLFIVRPLQDFRKCFQIVVKAQSLSDALCLMAGREIQRIAASPMVCSWR